MLAQIEDLVHNVRVRGSWRVVWPLRKVPQTFFSMGLVALVPLVECCPEGARTADVVTTTHRSNVAGLGQSFLDDLEAPVLQSQLFVCGHERESLQR